MALSGHSVLVTGSEGFIGSHLVEHLARRGARVRAFVLYNSFGDFGWLGAIAPEVRNSLDIVLGDVRDARSVRQAVEGADAVLHLAALIGIPYSYQRVESYVATNVTGTLNVLEACRDAGVSRVLVTSTSEVYGSAVRTPMDESHPLNPQSPYAASKVGADALAISYHRSYGLPVVLARPFNTFGPRQSPRAVLAAAALQALSGEDVKLGTLETVRDFTFVTDTCAGLAALADCDAAVGRVVNIGTGVGVKVGDAVNTVLAAAGGRARVAFDAARVRPPDSEVSELVCDSSLLRRLTGWTPGVPFEDGVRRMVEWFGSRPRIPTTGHYAI